MTRGPRSPIRRRFDHGLVARAVLGAAALVGVALVPAAAQAQEGGGAQSERRRHAVAVLGLLQIPSDEPVSEVYGGHPGFAARYSYRGGPRWSAAVDLGYRGPAGETPAFALETELGVVQLDGMLRYHPALGAPDAAFDLWVGGGVVVHWIDERVDFPDGPQEAEDQAVGWAVGAGFERLLGARWGVLGDVRFGRVSVSSELEGIEDTEMGGFEVRGGAFLRF